MKSSCIEHTHKLGVYQKSVNKEKGGALLQYTHGCGLFNGTAILLAA